MPPSSLPLRRPSSPETGRGTGTPARAGRGSPRQGRASKRPWTTTAWRQSTGSGSGVVDAAGAEGKDVCAPGGTGDDVAWERAMRRGATGQRPRKMTTVLLESGEVAAPGAGASAAAAGGEHAAAGRAAEAAGADGARAAAGDDRLVEAMTAANVAAAAGAVAEESCAAAATEPASADADRTPYVVEPSTAPPSSPSSGLGQRFDFLPLLPQLHLPHLPICLLHHCCHATCSALAP